MWNARTFGKFNLGGIPTIKGSINQVYLNSVGDDSGALYRGTTATNAYWYPGTGWGGGNINFDATRYNSIYKSGNWEHIVPSCLVMYYIIKY